MEMKPGVVKYLYDSLVETRNRHRSRSSSLKANLNHGNITKFQRSVIKEAKARLRLAEKRLERDDNSRAADDDSDGGSKMSQAKAKQTELSAHFHQFLL